MSECISCGQNDWKYTIVKGKGRVQKTCNKCGYQRSMTHAEGNAYALARECADNFEDLNTSEQQKKIRIDEKEREDEEHKDLVRRSKKWESFGIESLKIIYEIACYVDDLQNEKKPEMPHVDPFMLDDIIKEIKFVGDKKVKHEKERDGVRA